MGLFGIIKNVLRALAAYLELKNKAFYYKIVSDSRKNQKILSMKLKHYARLVLMLLTIGLTSCETSSLTKSGTLNIYQPPILNLQKGIPIQSKEGIYTPQTDEVWHSDARFRKLERELYFNNSGNK